MITAALIGNPNVGKTTLFNTLTGSNQYVGNWAGVTVEKKEGIFDGRIRIVDLPGIYALDTYSNEEKVAKDFLINGDVDVILDIIDGTNLDRNLYLTLQLMEFKKPIILIINMIDAVEDKGIKIKHDLLAGKLNMSVVPISASKGIGIEEIKKLLNGSDFLNHINDNDYHFNSESEAYAIIDGIKNECVDSMNINKTSVSDKIDGIILNKYLAFPIFLLILFLIFEFTFSWVGQPAAELLREGLNNYFVPILRNLLGNSSSWFKSLIIDGIVGGVGSVIVFLPVILTLFLGISFLEDSGYMARAAILTDRIMRRIGLSGKAFIPLVVGFGCSVPGIMAARTLESEKDRKLTALLVPLMSCNARLPVYALFASALFPGKQTQLVFSLYLLGILTAFIVGLVFKNTIFKKDEEPFLIELPEYKIPEIKYLVIHTWDKGKGFLKKAGTIIFSISVFVWFLSNFNLHGKVDIQYSLLAAIGKFISPIFSPLGFGTWENSVALLTGLMAKEVIVGTMGVLYGGNLETTLPDIFSKLSAVSFLVFVLLYTPCVSVIATMKREYGNKMAVISVIYQVTLAWIVSFLIFNIGGLLIK